MAFDIAVGSYPIYKKDDIDYCKWICLDVDSHKRVTKEEEEQLKIDFPKTWKIELHKLIKKYKKEIDTLRKFRQGQYSSVRNIYLRKIYYTKILVVGFISGYFQNHLHC